MSISTISSDDTLTLAGNVFTDLAFGDISTIELPNDLVNVKTGKNGNSAFALNAPGFNGNLAIRLMRGSSDDQFMAPLVPTSQGFSSTVLLNGTFVKSLGDGQGNITRDTYNLSGGVVSKIPSAKENVDGDTEQAVVAYMVKFANVSRVIS